MKIVNKKEFLKLPENTIYCSFDKNNFAFNGFAVKLESLENDWYYMDLTDFDNWDDSEERIENIQKMITEGKEYPLSLNCSSRDGMFEDDEMFCIYDKYDVERIMSVLSESIGL